MALLKIKDFAPDYAETLAERNIIDYSVYSDLTNEKIGTIKNILVNETDGEFCYLIVDIGFWIFGKEILLPIERAQFNFIEQRVYTKGLTKEQAEHLPEFNESLRIDSEYEQRLRAGYGAPTPTSVTDPLGNPVSPLTPFSPITIGTLASLTSPLALPYLGQPADITPKDNYPPDSAPARYRIEDDERSV